MKEFPTPLELSKIKVYPLAQRKSLSAIEGLLVNPNKPTAPCPPEVQSQILDCVEKITTARASGASVMLLYGAHLVKNGLLGVANALIERGWITHLATNGAGTIHDWELAFQGRTEESVRENVATGTFGTWDETGCNIHLALLAGALREEGYGHSLGRFIEEDGVTLPPTTELEKLLRTEPAHPLSPARAELLQAMTMHTLPAGRIEVKHHTRRVLSSRKLSVTIYRSPCIPASVTTSSPTTRCLTARQSVEQRKWTSHCSVERSKDWTAAWY